MRQFGPRKPGTTAKWGTHTLPLNPTPQRPSGSIIVVEGQATARGTAQEPPRVPPLRGGEGNRHGEAPGARPDGHPLPAGGGGGGGGNSSSSDSNSNGDDDADGMDEDHEEDEQEDPSDGQVGKTYTPRTEGGKAVAKMLRRFCRLAKADANAIIVYFGVYSENRPVEFQEAHWKDTFAQWKKWHTCPDGTERAMV